jgi:hypothetical protein
MNIRAKYPLPHAGKVIAAGSTADLPENLARMLIARGQAEDAASAPALPPPIAPQAAAAKQTAQPSPARAQG